MVWQSDVRTRLSVQPQAQDRTKIKEKKTGRQKENKKKGGERKKKEKEQLSLCSASYWVPNMPGVTMSKDLASLICPKTMTLWVT